MAEAGDAARKGVGRPCSLSKATPWKTRERLLQEAEQTRENRKRKLAEKKMKAAKKWWNQVWATQNKRFDLNWGWSSSCLG